MEKEKYYCVKLNGYNIKQRYYGLENQNTFLEGVLKKEYTTLDKIILDDDFGQLDNKVTILEDNVLVEGVFPIITKEKDGKLYDIVTNMEIPLIRNDNEFGYLELEEIPNYLVNFLLSILNDENKERYKNAINELKNDFYKNTVSYITYSNGEKLSSVEINGKMYESTSKNRIYEKKKDVGYYGVTYNKKEIGNEKCDNSKYNELLNNALIDYNNFVSYSFDFDSRQRIRK